MRIIVLGAGPLGLFYGGHLAKAGAHVTLVRRQASSAAETWPFVSRVTGARFECTFEVASEVPAGADVVVIAVRGEQLTPVLLDAVLRTRPRGVVCLTPDLSGQLARHRSEHSEVVAAMPAVAAEVEQGTLYYWAPPRFLRPLGWLLPRTLVQRRGANSALRGFVTLLRRAAVPVAWTADAAERGVADTVVLFPLHVAIYLRPEMNSWPTSGPFLEELAFGLRRARRLARALGPVDLGLSLLAWWLSTPRRLAVSVMVLLRVAPRVVRFLEHHFGPKLAAQHAVLLRDVLALSNEHRLPAPLSERWLPRLTRRDAEPS